MAAPLVKSGGAAAPSGWSLEWSMDDLGAWVPSRVSVSSFDACVPYVGVFPAGLDSTIEYRAVFRCAEAVVQ
jgi:hypothetical protein